MNITMTNNQFNYIYDPNLITIGIVLYFICCCCCICCCPTLIKNFRNRRVNIIIIETPCLSGNVVADIIPAHIDKV